MNCFNGD
jgi:hypothetical protein